MQISAPRTSSDAFGKRARATVLAALLAGCTAAETAPPQTLPEVGVMTVATEAAELRAQLPGRTAPFTVSDVRPQIGGLIQSRHFREGGSVRKGQLLYQVDAAPFRAAYDQARANLARAEATLRSAGARAARFGELVDIDAVSRQEADDAAAAKAQAQADVAAARAAVQTARINLGYTRITAPISGRIGRSSFTPGALVTAGQAAPLATIQSLDPIYVDITQSSAEMLRLKRAVAQGNLARGGDATARVNLTLADGSRYPLEGVLEFSEVSVDPSTGAVVLRARFPNPDGTLLPGMYVKASLTEAIDPDAILVPQAAITRDEKGRAVAMVVGDGDKIERRLVAAPRTIGNRWFVTAGLKPGESLVVDGFQNFRPGDRVKPVATKSAKSAKAAR